MDSLNSTLYQTKLSYYDCVETTLEIKFVTGRDSIVWQVPSLLLGMSYNNQDSYLNIIQRFLAENRKENEQIILPHLTIRRDGSQLHLDVSNDISVKSCIEITEEVYSQMIENISAWVDSYQNK